MTVLPLWKMANGNLGGGGGTKEQQGNSNDNVIVVIAPEEDGLAKNGPPPSFQTEITSFKRNSNDFQNAGPVPSKVPMLGERPTQSIF